METPALIFVILVYHTGCCNGQHALPPGPLSEKVGGNITFTTTISSTSPAFVIINWTFNDGTGPVSVIGLGPGGSTPGSGYEGRMSMNSTTGSLELRQLTLKDSGEYSVNLVSSTGVTLTGQTTLNVYDAVSNMSVSANATNLVEFNDTVELTCSAFGSSLYFKWHNGSSEITNSERVHLSNGNRTLTISRVLRSDRGPLYCTVHNVISSDASQPVFLNISFGPDNVKVTVEPPKEFHIPGSNLTLSCSAQSSPPAEIKWGFNGTMLNTEGQDLKLEDIKENESGSYTCWAYNSITLRSKPSDPLLISVIEKISSANITGPTEVLIAGSSSARLSCQAAVGTLISRQWLKNGYPLFPSNRIKLSDDNSSVSINPVQGIDNGQYQCRLTNPVSTDSASYNLTVNYGPEDVVIQGHSEIEVGLTVVLTCSALSVPPATFTWIFNMKETAIKTESYTVANSTFDDSGNYTCVAKNSVTGSTVSSAPHFLTVVEPISGSQLGAILGGTFGALGCVAVAGGAFAYMKKRRRKDSPSNQDPPPAVYENSTVVSPPVVYENVPMASADLSHPADSENIHEYEELRFRDTATYSTMNSHSSTAGQTLVFTIKSLK